MNDIPALRLSTLTKLIERFTRSPKLLLMKLFGEDKWPSDEIEWEAQTGDRGMTPFSNEDVPAPRVVPTGVSGHKAKAAYWKEKMFFGSSFLNNIRKPGTRETFYSTKKFLAPQMRMLRNRCDRRKEWMICKMLTAGEFEYIDPNNKRVAVDYGIPIDHMQVLDADRKWDQDTSKMVEDIMDAKIYMENANSSELDFAMFPSEILKVMVVNKSVQTLLQKSAYGQGDLFARPLQVLGDLLNIKNMVLYNEMYQIRGWLTAALPAGAGPHTIFVDEATDFEPLAKIFANSITGRTKESLTVTGVDPIAGTITATGTLTNSYKPQEDVITMTKKFLPLNKFCMFASEVEGQRIAEFMLSPFGMDRHYGRKLDRWEKKDPDGLFIRVENKGLPVLYFEDSIFVYTVL